MTPLRSPGGKRHNGRVRTERIGPLVTGSLLAMCVLTGCSGPSPSVAETVRPGIPPGVVLEQPTDGPVATWIERGETFAIVTWGSGSCPAVATALSAAGVDRLTVTFGPSPNDPCTADMAPTTHEFQLPEEVTADSVVIEVSYEDWPETHTLTLD